MEIHKLISMLFSHHLLFIPATYLNVSWFCCYFICSRLSLEAGKELSIKDAI